VEDLFTCPFIWGEASIALPRCALLPRWQRNPKILLLIFKKVMGKRMRQSESFVSYIIISKKLFVQAMLTTPSRDAATQGRVARRSAHSDYVVTSEQDVLRPGREDFARFCRDAERVPRHCGENPFAKNRGKNGFWREKEIQKRHHAKH
jgi:hypothetical protein